MPDGFAHLSAGPEDLPSGPAGLAGTREIQSKSEAASGYLDALLGLNRLEGPRGLIDTATDKPEFRMLREDTIDVTDSTVVAFEQTAQEIPVFGSKAIVEVDSANEFLAASISVADLQEASYDARINAGQATEALAQFLSTDRIAASPRKVLLPNPDEGGKVYLAWHFQHVPVAPGSGGEEETGDNHILIGCCGSDSIIAPDFDYFVNAENGEVVFYFSNTPHVEIPTWCRGEDVDGVNQKFLGRVNGGNFAMENPFEAIKTTDLEFHAYNSGRAPATITNATNDWLGTHPAAVSAHVNATRVVDFLYRVLRRKSIDDAGMTIENVTNVTENGAGTQAEWLNAVWYQQKMWYGQRALSSGGFQSLARWLDVIGHELFHGITEKTANLVYRRLPGALNESISDIFGVIIYNWNLAPDPADVETWNWEIGSGLQSGNLPFRSMSNPSSVGRWRKPGQQTGQVVTVNGYPDHMNQYVQLPVTQFYDWGGVHWFSSIHNFAAFKVLTSERADGSKVFTPEEVAVLYYLALIRLTQLSNFSDARRELLAVCGRVYAGDAARNAEATNAIESAYTAVGIQ